MSRLSCLIIETDQEAIRQIDILSKRIGAIEVRWKTHSVQTGIDIIRMHLPEMVIVGLGPTPEPAIASISMMAKDFPFLYLVALSDRTDSDLILRTIRAGAHDYLCKPVKEIDLRAAAEKASKLKATRKESGGRGG